MIEALDRVTLADVTEMAATGQLRAAVRWWRSRAVAPRSVRVEAAVSAASRSASRRAGRVLGRPQHALHVLADARLHGRDHGSLHERPPADPRPRRDVRACPSTAARARSRPRGRHCRCPPARPRPPPASASSIAAAISSAFVPSAPSAAPPAARRRTSGPAIAAASSTVPSATAAECDTTTRPTRGEGVRAHGCPLSGGPGECTGGAPNGVVLVSSPWPAPRPDHVQRESAYHWSNPRPWTAPRRVRVRAVGPPPDPLQRRPPLRRRQAPAEPPPSVERLSAAGQPAAGGARRASGSAQRHRGSRTT